MNSNDNRKPAPRIVGWIGVAVSIAVIVMCILTLTGCFPWAHRACKYHGGLDWVANNKGLMTAHCHDGTSFVR